MEDTINEAIVEVIENIPPNSLFDSHYVIQQLLKKYTEKYYEFIRVKYHADVPAVHGLLAQEIAKNKNIMKLNDLHIEFMDIQSWSENIRGNASLCTAWVKR